MIYIAYYGNIWTGRQSASRRPGQARTIPINKSINVEHHVATYDQVRAIAQNSPGPFVVLKCICRQGKALRNVPCAKTSRSETCLGLGNMAAMVLRRNHGREVTRDEVLAILQQNEDDGLVLQPANSQQPEFVCSCCGCCCGLCVPTCPSEAVRLKKKTTETSTPIDGEELYDEIMANKTGAIKRLRMLLKVALKMKQ
jgi:hypothetical protein